jgi:hypothetical protein
MPTPRDDGPRDCRPPAPHGRLVVEQTTTADNVEESLPLPPPSGGIPFDPADYLDLAPSDHENDDDDENSKIDLVLAFREPLFPNDPSRPLAIAYSHLYAAKEERKRIRAEKVRALRDLKDLREVYASRRGELLDLNATLGTSSNRVRSWTRRVFDLELKEPGCPWNDKLRMLREYVERHGKIPEHALKVRGNDEERVLAAFVSKERSKAKAGHWSTVKYPHRFRALERLGVTWESDNDARFEVMFGKLLEYRREHGTFRMPSLELCRESGDEDLILLHNWVFSQIGGVRYQLRTKRVEVVKRFLDVGFSFERWYATNGHVFDRDIPPFDSICRRYVDNGGKLDEDDAEILRVANESHLKRRKRRRKDARVDGGGETRAEAASDEANNSNSTAINVEAAVGQADVNMNFQLDDESAPTAKIWNEVVHASEPPVAAEYAVVDNTGDSTTATLAPALAPAILET